MDLRSPDSRVLGAGQWCIVLVLRGLEAWAIREEAVRTDSYVLVLFVDNGGMQAAHGQAANVSQHTKAAARRRNMCCWALQWQMTRNFSDREA